jgi:hypothetical protein
MIDAATTILLATVLLILWVHVVVLCLLLLAPDRIDAAKQRWPKVVQAIERGQQILAILMLLLAALGVTGLIVWSIILSHR